MEWIYSILDSETAPVLTAFLLGLITAISPCPLATNIAAIGFIGNDIEDRKKVFIKGILYTIGRIFAYTLLGIVLISILREGASVFGIQKQISKWGELLVGPLLIIMGLFILFGDRLNLPKFGFSGNGEGLVKKRWMGCIPYRHIIRLGILSIERYLLFRYVDPHVGDHNCRMVASCNLCHCHSFTGACGSLDISFQCETGRKLLWENAENTEMG